MRSDLGYPQPHTMSLSTERFLNVSPIRQSSSAPHSRSCSFKKNSSSLSSSSSSSSNSSSSNNSTCSCSNYCRRPHYQVDLSELRPRTNSLPSRPVVGGGRQRHSSDPAEQDREDRFCRVRSFKVTSKGLVKNRDSFKRRSTHSLMSTGSTATDLSSQGGGVGGGGSQPGQGFLQAPHGSRPRTLSLASEESSGIVSCSGSGCGSCCAPSYFRVALMGEPGVGKSALIRQFMSSEYRGTFDIVTPDAEDPETTVSVMLDGDESMIEFIEQPKETELDNLRADAFVIVFSLADKESFTCAVKAIRHLRVDLGSDRAILLVANKVDLARQRRVHLSDARMVAMKYDCLLEETSAALNHQVDELLVTILTQIRLRLAPPPDLCPSSSSSSFALLPPQPPVSKPRSPTGALRAMSFLSKLFTQNKKKARSCDNLLIQ